MKHIAKTALKGLFIVILFTTGTVALSTAGVKTVSEANAAVSYNQIYEYLLAKGYTVVSAEPSTLAKFDWVAHTILNGRHLTTTIHCNANEVITNSDVAF